MSSPLAFKLERLGLDPLKDIAVLTVASDGLRLKRDSLMSVSVARGGKVETMYIEGARPEQCMGYTNTPPDIYHRLAVPPKDAAGRLVDFLEGCGGWASYRVSEYTGPWLDKLEAPAVSGLPALDLLNVFSAKDAGVADMPEGDSFMEISAWYAAAEGHRLCLKELLGRYDLLRHDRLPSALSRIVQTESLWRVALGRLPDGKLLSECVRINSENRQ